MADSFIFEEQGSNPARVELKGSDMPFGRVRRIAAFEVGGDVETKEIYLQGRSEPIVHVEQMRFPPLTIKGAFRDHMFGVNGHALEMKRQVMQIAKRVRPLNITWGPFKWSGYMKKPRLSIEDDANIPYEIEFRIFKELTDDTTRPTQNIESSPTDLTAQIRANLAERRAASLIEFLLIEAVVTMRNAFDDVEEALDAVETAAENYANATTTAGAEAQALTSTAERAKQSVTTLMGIVDDLTPEASLSSSALGPAAELWRFQGDTALECLTAIDGMRTLQETTLLTSRTTERLYQVGESDTIESIAKTHLGSPALADKLKIRPQDLKPGKYISLPPRS